MASILSREELSEVIGKLQSSGKKIVFTNGVFDILHKGHVDYLSKARSFGDILVVGINSDSSVKRIKGERRPIVPQSDRRLWRAALPTAATARATGPRSNGPSGPTARSSTTPLPCGSGCSSSAGPIRGCAA